MNAQISGVAGRAPARRNPRPPTRFDRADCAETSFTFLGYTFRARNAPTRDGTTMFTGFLPAVSKDALKRMSEEVRSWRIHLRAATELQDLADWINPIVRGSPGDLLRQVLQDRARPPATAHQHLPDALGTKEIQTATPIQESPEMVARADRKAATHVRPRFQGIARMLSLALRAVGGRFVPMA